MGSRHGVPTGPIRAVTFDLWNTLLTSVPGGLEVRRRYWEEVIEERRLDIPPTLLEGVLSILPDRFETEWRTGRHYGPERALEECFVAFGDRVDAEDCRALADAFDLASYHLQVIPVPDAANVLSAVAGRGLLVGIVSDTNLAIGRHLRTYLDRYGILEHVHFAAFSDEVGVYKPSPLIFQAALYGLGVDDPASVIHVGDLKRTDVAGARNFGMGTVRFNGAIDDDEPGEDADHVIDDLIELLDLLSHLTPIRKVTGKSRG